MQVLHTISELRKVRSQLRGTLGLVPTMGYLHDGHLALVRRAKAENDLLAVTIFVNPSQFGPNEDFSSYPRDMDRDLSLLRDEGTHLVFAPTPQEMYPLSFDTWVEVGHVAQRLEGQLRPGHFRGVATVVAKLFNVVEPDRAYFGQKDGQQAVVIKRMVEDLNLGVEVVVVPTVREADGLALSSRNVYLTPQQREAAPVIYKSLCTARELWEKGESDAQHLVQEVRRVLGLEPLIDCVQYVSVADSSTLEELDVVSTSAMISVAVVMGNSRLIDNVVLGPADAS